MRVYFDSQFVGVNDGSTLATIGNFKARPASLLERLDDSNKTAAVIYNSLSEPVGLNASGRVVSATAVTDAAASASAGGTPTAPVYAVQPTGSGAPTASSSFDFSFTPPQGAGTYVVTFFADDANGNLVAVGQVTINSTTGADTTTEVSLSPVAGQSSSAAIATLNIGTGNFAAGLSEEQSFDVATSWSQVGPPTGPIRRPL